MFYFFFEVVRVVKLGLCFVIIGVVVMLVGSDGIEMRFGVIFLIMVLDESRS